MSMKRPLDNEDDQGGVKKRLEAGEVVFSGRIESMDPVTRSSLIHCHEIARQSCKALKASNQLVLSSMAAVGDSVAFFLRWSREGPQASPPMVRLRCGDDNFALLGKFRTGTAGYGFVSCDLMTEFFGRDAHVERDLAQTFETGQTVCFNVSITQGMPMVTEMSACLPDWHPTPSDVPLEIETAESVEPLQALDPEEPQQCHDEPSEPVEPLEPSEVSQLVAPVEPEPSTGDEWNQWNQWNQGRDDWKKWSDWKDWSPDWSSWPSDWSWHAEGAGQGERLGKKATGVIKSFNERTNYGFIECKELADIYGRDTFVHGKEFQGHYVGEKVSFTVYLGPRGQPQAFNVEKIREKKHWDKPKASGAKRKDRSCGEEKTKNSFLLGIVTSYFPERGCGFIECDEVRRKYGQEVYVFKDVLADSLAGPGDLVAFYLHLSKQKKAQASHPMLRLKTGTAGTFALKGRFEAVAKGVTQIHCPETLNFFGSPVRVNQRLGSKLEAGSAVSFNVTVSDQGYPLAYNAEPCDDQWLPTATQLTLATEATAWDAWKAKESGNGYSGYGGSSPASRTAVLIGRIKSFDSENYGFIESDLVSSACGCDAMVTGEDLSDFEVGETVLFEVSFAHSRQPQARYVRRCAI